MCMLVRWAGVSQCLWLWFGISLSLSVRVHLCQYVCVLVGILSIPKVVEYSDAALCAETSTTQGRQVAATEEPKAPELTGKHNLSSFILLGPARVALREWWPARPGAAGPRPPGPAPGSGGRGEGRKG